MAKFGVTATELGDFSGAYYLGYALMHIPLGVLLDRYGPKWVIPGSIVLSVGGLLPLVYLDSWTASVVGRFLIGAGSSGAILGVFTIIRLHFCETRFSRMLGISVMFGLVGAVYGGYPVGYLSAHYGWESLLLSFVFVGLLLAFAMTFVGPQKVSLQSQEPSFLENIIRHKKALLGRVFLTALMAALMIGPLEGFADVWATSFLVHVYGYEKDFAASLSALIFIGTGVGSPLLALAAEHLRAYYPVVLFAAAGMGTCFVILLATRPSPFILGFLFFMIGVLSAYQLLVIYMNGKNVAAPLVSVVSALTNMIIMSFGWVFHKSITLMMDVFQESPEEKCLPVYSPEAYTYGLMVIPTALFVAFIGFMFLQRRAPIK